MQAIGELDLVAAMPAGLIEHQHDLLVAAQVQIDGKFVEGDAKRLGIHRWQQEPKGVPSCGLDEGIELQPLIAVGYPRDRALTFARPDPAQDWLEPDAMFIHRPHLDGGSGMGGAHDVKRVRQGLF